MVKNCSRVETESAVNQVYSGSLRRFEQTALPVKANVCCVTAVCAKACLMRKFAFLTPCTQPPFLDITERATEMIFYLGDALLTRITSFEWRS